MVGSAFGITSAFIFILTIFILWSAIFTSIYLLEHETSKSSVQTLPTQDGIQVKQAH